MKIVHTLDPGVLELRSEATGCVVFVGLLFIAGGAFGAAFALDMLPVEAYVEPELKRIMLAASALGVMLGLVFVGGRSGKIFDRSRQSLTSWWGVFAPMRHKHQRLDGYSKVVLAKKIHRGSNTSTVLFPVRLEGERDTALQIDTGTDYHAARGLAEAVARALHWPLADSTSGEAVVREPDHLDESLRDRMRRLGERVELSPRPHTMRSQARVTSSEVVVEIPGMSTKARLIINLVVITIALGIGFFFVAAPLIARGTGQWTEILPMILFAAFFDVTLLVVVLGKLRGLNRAVRVTANRVALRVVKGKRTTEIPGDQLEELSISGLDINQLFQTRPDGSLVIDPSHLDTPEGTAHTAAHGQPPTVPPALAGFVKTLGTIAPEKLSILARSDRTSVSFGGGLDSDEITYLYTAIMKAMVD